MRTNKRKNKGLAFSVRRNNRGRYAKSYWQHFSPLLFLGISMLISLLVQKHYQNDELINPCENDGCSFFMVRAVETIEPETVKDTEIVVLSEKEQIIHYITQVFGKDAPDAFNILHCENRGLNPKAVNHNRNGTRDLGIFQLNDAYWGGEENFDWKTNIDKAHKIFKNGGWSQWSCSHRIGVTPFYLKGKN